MNRDPNYTHNHNIVNVGLWVVVYYHTFRPSCTCLLDRKSPLSPSDVSYVFDWFPPQSKTKQERAENTGACGAQRAARARADS